MECRYEVRRRQLLEDARLRPQVSRGMLECQEAFVQPFVASLRRQGAKAHASDYVEGFLLDLVRKNAESIAYRHDQDRKGVQHFVGVSQWAPDPLEKELVRQVGTTLGQPDGVIVFDPSGFRKCGKESVGVGRQWSGRLGKLENCRIGIYMWYVSDRDHALCVSRLYLPEGWAHHRKRRKKCTVPKTVPAVTVPLIRGLLDTLLRQACDQRHPGWEHRTLQRKTTGREDARFFHHKKRDRLAPQRFRK